MLRFLPGLVAAMAVVVHADDAMDTTLPVCVQPAATSEYQHFVDLFMIISVGISSLIVLFRILSRPPNAAAAGGNARQTPPSRVTLSNAAALRSASYPALPVGKRGSANPKERLDTLLPRRSSYFSLPFFSDSIANKQDFIESLIELGDDQLDGWLLVKRATQRGKAWKKRFVIVDENGRIKYFQNADAARKNVNTKGSLMVYAVKPADPMEFGANTLEVRGTLGGKYIFRAENEMMARKWLVVLTKRAIQVRVPGRIDSNPSIGVLSRDAAQESTTGEANTLPMKSHALEAFVEDMTYGKEAPLRQFYVVVKFKSELHDHSHVPVGQTIPKPCDKGAVNWQEKLAWHFQDHLCNECEECRAIGSTTGSFKGVPDVMILHVYEVHLRYLTTKIGQVAISLKELFGFLGMKEGSIKCTWPVISSNDAVLGQLTLRLQYNVDLAGGAALQPFLVTTDSERELIGEYEVHPSIKTCAEFFDLFYANGTTDRWQAYWKARGDTEIEVGEWSESREYGGQVREQTFRSLTNASIGPSSTMATTTQHVTFSDVSQLEGDSFIIESRNFLHDIPYGDCFTVEQVFVVERGASGAFVVKVYLGIPFSKGCMFKSKIISATREGVTHSNRLMFDELNKTVENGGGSIAGPSKPFLVSAEDERQLLGEYELPPSILTVSQFFDLFYANDTLTRWQALYKETGDCDHEVEPWKDGGEYGGLVRTIKFRAQNNAALGPPSTAATTENRVVLPKEGEGAENRLVLETKMALHDIPFGDTFTVETQYVIEGKDANTPLVARVYAAIPFSKSTMFKGKITSATKDGVIKSTKQIFDYFRKVMEGEASGVSVATPGSEPVMQRVSLEQRLSNVSVSSAKEVALTGRRSSTHSESEIRSAPPQRFRLARLNSTLDGVALEEIFENQRVSLFGKWGPNHLLPTDRARFSNRVGNQSMSFEQVSLPPHWVWTSPWKIDKSYTECDEEGWSYATDFPRFKTHLARGKSSNRRLGASVRRRRWIRMMAYVPPEGTNGNSSDIESDAIMSAPSSASNSPTASSALST
ncbi:hypothetical protein Poli38472_001042 [Pythium oligandrum]|uniref:Uncharacterized protein n=1 Tax=Pythium oligandrum TaxID=41045 RepID=A0A8K1CS84_PYTOL|nr:hypothetical protein Poli38472_001042 [Pythium oligandrum]|eukprot:TMW68886.1 hypothetical protein Poli38472_001042 [Pythium oligandrum]